MLSKFSRFSVLLGTTLILTCRIAMAQPTTEDAPKATNPPNAGGITKTPEEMAQLAKDTNDLLKMPRAERQAKIFEMQQGILRNAFKQAGFDDVKLQDAVIDCLMSQEKERDKVRLAGSKVYPLAASPKAAATDAQIIAAMNAFLATVEDAAAQRQAAEKTLDERINYRKNPRLAALLTLYGVIGDSVSYVGDVQMTGIMGLGALMMY